jgi:hypothetical protein
MVNLDLKNATVDELVAAYVEDAAAYGRLSDVADYEKANREAGSRIDLPGAPRALARCAGGIDPITSTP